MPSNEWDQSYQLEDDVMRNTQIVIAATALVFGVTFALTDLRNAYGQCAKEEGCTLQSRECRDCDGGPCGYKKVGVSMQTFFWEGPAPGGYHNMEWLEDWSACFHYYNCAKITSPCPLDPEYKDCGTTYQYTWYTPDDWIMWDSC